MSLRKKYDQISLPSLLEEIQNKRFFWIVKRLSGNDTGLTGSKQVGIYLPDHFFKKFFPEICTTEVFNPDAFFKEIYFPGHDYLKQGVRAVYYNSKYFPEKKLKKKYDEFRITQWGGRSAPVQNPENTGSILLLAAHRINGDAYALSWVNNNIEEETIIEEWIGNEISPGMFYSSDFIQGSLSFKLPTIPDNWLKSFPSTEDISNLVNYRLPFNPAKTDIDSLLIKRRELELSIFHHLENKLVSNKLKDGFDSTSDFFKYAKSALQRRYSRSGRSLELHLKTIFSASGLKFEDQATTEGKKRPDFLFPSRKAYRNPHYPVDKLFVLGAKTTLKDRWRQILSEADRIRTKHLFTLQEGVSENQYSEMVSSNVALVVPEQNRKKFPAGFRSELLNLRTFVDIVKESQA